MLDSKGNCSLTDDNKTFEEKTISTEGSYQDKSRKTRTMSKCFVPVSAQMLLLARNDWGHSPRPSDAADIPP